MTARLLLLLACVSACRGGFAQLDRDAGSGGNEDGAVVDDGGVGDGAMTIIDGAIVDGAPGDGTTMCAGTLSDVGTGDFEISFRIVTTATSGALLWQRTSCSAPPYWDVSMGTGGLTGRAVLAVRDASISASSPTSVAINDGAPHDVLITRIAGTLSVVVDGGSPNSQTTAVSFGPLGALAVLQGSHPCGTPAAVATLTSICVRPL